MREREYNWRTQLYITSSSSLSDYIARETYEYECSQFFIAFIPDWDLNHTQLFHCRVSSMFPHSFPLLFLILNFSVDLSLSIRRVVCVMSLFHSSSLFTSLIPHLCFSCSTSLLKGSLVCPFIVESVSAFFHAIPDSWIQWILVSLKSHLLDPHHHLDPHFLYSFVSFFLSKVINHNDPQETKLHIRKTRRVNKEHSELALLNIIFSKNVKWVLSCSRFPRGSLLSPRTSIECVIQFCPSCDSWEKRSSLDLLSLLHWTEWEALDFLPRLHLGENAFSGRGTLILMAVLVFSMPDGSVDSGEESIIFSFSIECIDVSALVVVLLF